MSRRKRPNQVVDLPIAQEKSKALQTEHAENLLNLTRNARSNEFTNAFNSTVLFAQYECGTGVCIGQQGVILTCAHCVDERPRVGMTKLVIFSDGLICTTSCTKIDIKCDLALLTIDGVYDKLNNLDNSPRTYPFSYFGIPEQLKIKAMLICIGQPGRDDLESTEERKTEYSLIHTSRGTYQGCAVGDVMDNSDLGRLQHSCWTYWGHSGAPLFNKYGQIIGLHSSWDDETCTRHGVHLNAIIRFVPVDLTVTPAPATSAGTAIIDLTNTHT